MSNQLIAEFTYPPVDAPIAYPREEFCKNVDMCVEAAMVCGRLAPTEEPDWTELDDVLFGMLDINATSFINSYVIDERENEEHLAAINTLACDALTTIYDVVKPAFTVAPARIVEVKVNTNLGEITLTLEETANEY